jgi:hypothetical protein
MAPRWSGLEFLLSGHEFCIEVVLDRALIYRDRVPPAHMRRV